MKRIILLTAIAMGATFALYAQIPDIVIHEYVINDEVLAKHEIYDPCNPSFEENTTFNSAFYFNKPVTAPYFQPPRHGDNLTFRIFSGVYCSNVKASNIEFKVNNSTKLSIRGEDGRIYIPFNVGFVFGRSRDEGENRMVIFHTGTHGYIDYKDNLHFRADKNWISALTLYGNGSVGIGFGTTYNEGQYLNMGYKLAVNGGIVCEEVKVIADVPDADYVFEEDYNLAPLSEIETFIKENKHLPNIPSAQEFKDNGYKVGEMDGMLLRKVEELMLYTIEQQKLIEELQKQVKELQEIIKKGDE